MTLKKGAELIAEFLIAEKIPYVFGICGHGNVGLLDALYDVKDDITLISPRHEQVAGHMADAYFRVKHQAVATLTAPDGLQMRIVSDQPCAQVYTAAALPPQSGALSGQQIGPAIGVCFEPQGFPNAVNLPQFPSVIATPDHPYRQRLRLEFG